MEELSEAGPFKSTTKPVKRGRGRPRGSKVKSNPPQNDSFLSTKEHHDLEPSKQLRRIGKITTPGEPFEASNGKEFDALIAGGIFRFEKYDPLRHTERIFNSQMVREVKNNNTELPYEKSRLVVQGFNDEGKSVILTQSPTIQRTSQHIILALAPTLKERGIRVYLPNITQAYTQLITNLNRRILAHLPKRSSIFTPAAPDRKSVV